jgi:predicted carbohydrate-binding protein with CBM5 and CBM33 domain
MSTNLSSASWISLFITNNPATNAFLLTDPHATNQQRFYRILIGP